MSGLAIILARSGSKGLPGKNLRLIAGRPCVAWTIDAALRAREAGAVSRVVLSGDGAELRAAADSYGVDFIERPAELASDTATIDAAARHALSAVERGDGARDPIVILYGSVPVRPAGLIERGVELIRRAGADSVQSYAPVGKHHPWWTAVVGERGEVRAWDGGVLNHGVFRRQDLPAAHVPDGGLIVVRRAALMLEVAGVAPGPHAFFGRDRRGIVSPEGSVVDIDSEVDAIVADAILSSRSTLGGARA